MHYYVPTIDRNLTGPVIEYIQRIPTLNCSRVDEWYSRGIRGIKFLGSIPSDSEKFFNF